VTRFVPPMVAEALVAKFGSAEQPGRAAGDA
jgi:hypothetical protein